MFSHNASFVWNHSSIYGGNDFVYIWSEQMWIDRVASDEWKTTRRKIVTVCLCVFLINPESKCTLLYAICRNKFSTYSIYFTRRSTKFNGTLLGIMNFPQFLISVAFIFQLDTHQKNIPSPVDGPLGTLMRCKIDSWQILNVESVDANVVFGRSHTRRRSFMQKIIYIRAAQRYDRVMCWMRFERHTPLM